MIYGVSLHCVFHSIRFKVNKDWNSAEFLFLCPLVGSSPYPCVCHPAFILDILYKPAEQTVFFNNAAVTRYNQLAAGARHRHVQFPVYRLPVFHKAVVRKKLQLIPVLHRE